MKKISYNTQSTEELIGELKSLQTTVSMAVAKSRVGKNSKEYVVARKNIARVMTALRQREIAEFATTTDGSKASSTEVEK